MATKIESCRVVEIGSLDYTTKKQKARQIKLNREIENRILSMDPNFSNYKVYLKYVLVQCDHY